MVLESFLLREGYGLSGFSNLPDKPPYGFWVFPDGTWIIVHKSMEHAEAIAEWFFRHAGKLPEHRKKEVEELIRKSKDSFRKFKGYYVGCALGFIPIVFERSGFGIIRVPKEEVADFKALPVVTPATTRAEKTAKDIIGFYKPPDLEIR